MSTAIDYYQRLWPGREIRAIVEDIGGTTQLVCTDGENIYLRPERWLPVPGSDERYLVSTYGRVKRAAEGQGARAGLVLSTPSDGSGHPRFNLYDGSGSVRTVLVHRVMAEAFLPNPDGYPLVRHLNDIPDDNRVENLAWGTYAHNSRDMVDNGHHRGSALTHCTHGHEFTPENTHTYRGRRICRRCVIIRTKSYRQRKRGNS